MSDAESKLKIVRQDIAKRHMFFVRPLMRLPFVEDNKVDTMATDGQFIYWNRQFVEALTIEQLIFVTCHEICHVLFMHTTRRGNRDHEIFNQAADYVVNLFLKNYNFKMPDGVLLSMDYVKLGAEEVYDLLVNNQDEDDQGGDSSGSGEQSDDGESSGSDSGLGNEQSGEDGQSQEERVKDKIGDASTWGEVIDAKNEDGQDLTPAEKEQKEIDTATLLHEAYQTEKNQGKSPQGLKAASEALDTIKSEELPWDQLLQQHLLELTESGELTYSRLDSRLMHHDILFPSEEPEPKCNLVFSIDCSASLWTTKEELEQISFHCQQIAEVMSPDSVTVIYCDDTIRSVDEFDSTQEVVIRKVHGGGTNFAPPFNYCLAHNIEPDVMIYFTDGEGYVGGGNPSLDETPNYPVIWCTNSIEPYGFEGEEFGEVVYM
jgi:predicted metal-dependent peptidase